MKYLAPLLAAAALALTPSVALAGGDDGHYRPKPPVPTPTPIATAPVPGPVGPSGPAGPPGVTTTVVVNKTVVEPRKKCVSRRTLSVKLPGRFKRGQQVRITVGGQDTSMRVRNGRVGVSLVGRPCGVYGVAFRKRGIEPFKRLYIAGPAGNVTAYNVPLAKR